MAVDSQSAGPPLEVDMTPLIDVTFLLLVFFMVISVFNEVERTAALELPVALQANIEQDVAKERMIVNVERDGTIRLYNQTMDMTGFRERLGSYVPFLRALGSRTGEAPIVLRGDRLCEYRHIRDILSAIYAEGFKTIKFATLPPQRPEEG